MAVTLRYSDGLRDDRLNVISRAIGSGAKMRLFSCPQPERTESADPLPEMLLAEIDLPPQPFLPAAASRLMSGHEPWRGLGLRRAGNGTVIQSFRLYDAAGTCHLQGTVSTEEGADLVLTHPKIAAGQRINIENFVIAELG